MGYWWGDRLLGEKAILRNPVCMKKLGFWGGKKAIGTKLKNSENSPLRAQKEVFEVKYFLEAL